MLRVLIADDHGIVRSGIRLLLERQPDLEVIAEAADGAEARDLAVRERPDLAILDVKMPKLTGLQATREIKRQAPEVSVLILSMHDDERYLFEALKAGASGLKLFPGEALGPDVVKAWRAVLPKETQLYPVGGVTPERMGPYRRAGATGFGIGSALYRPGASVDEVRRAAQTFVTAWSESA